jgi:DNA-binding CsgD family transcriptional regulator
VTRSSAPCPIARALSVIIGISESTVNRHVYNVMAKLEAINRPQAVAVAARLGLVEVD